MNDQHHPPTTSHNYLKKVADLGLTLAPGAEMTMDFAHDNWCDALNGRGFCNCDPDVIVREGLQGKPMTQEERDRLGKENP